MDEKLGLTKRRTFLKTSIWGSLIGALFAVNPLKITAKSKVRNDSVKIQVKPHPFAIKRNKEG